MGAAGKQSLTSHRNHREDGEAYLFRVRKILVILWFILCQVCGEIRKTKDIFQMSLLALWAAQQEEWVRKQTVSLGCSCFRVHVDKRKVNLLV